MLRKAMFAAAAGLALVGASATAASALDCANVSRPAPTQPAAPVAQVGPVTVWVTQGEWWYLSFDGVFADGVWDFVPPGAASTVLGLSADQAAALGLSAGTVNGNYQAGQGFGLLDRAQAPCLTVRQTDHGIQAESMQCS